jgi:hypothetical protein
LQTRQNDYTSGICPESVARQDRFPTLLVFGDFNPLRMTPGSSELDWQVGEGA